MLTDRRRAAAAGRDLPETVAAVVAGGATAVVFREKDLPIDERTRLGAEVRAAAGATPVHVAGDPALAERLGAAGVHLAADQPWPATDLVVGRSCHDAGELAAAAAHRVDLVTLSPVWATASKPGYGPPLGTDGLAALVAGTGLAVYALGGITDPERARACIAAGAVGVAVMGAAMAAPDPEAFVRSLLDQEVVA